MQRSSSQVSKKSNLFFCGFLITNDRYLLIRYSEQKGYKQMGKNLKKNSNWLYF